MRPILQGGFRWLPALVGLFFALDDHDAECLFSGFEPCQGGLESRPFRIALRLLELFLCLPPHVCLAADPSLFGHDGQLPVDEKEVAGDTVRGRVTTVQPGVRDDDPF